MTRQQIFYEQRAKLVRWFFLNTDLTRQEIAARYEMPYSTVCSLIKGHYRPNDNRGPLSHWRRTCGRA